MTKTRNAFIVLFALGLAVATAWAAGRIAVVRTRENYIREQPRFFAAILATVKFEDQFEVLDEKAGWLHVRHESVEGWIPQSAVVKRAKMTHRPVLLGPEGEPTDDEEVALAGKGFNADVERQMKEAHPELNFTQVDGIESYAVPPADVLEFIRQGGLEAPL